MKRAQRLKIGAGFFYLDIAGNNIGYVQNDP